MNNIINKLKVSPRQKDLFLVVLISLVAVYAFVFAWSETTFSDDITVMPFRVIQRAERTTDEHEKLRIYDSLKTAINSYLVKKPGNIYLNYYVAYIYSRTNDYQNAIATYRKNLSKLDSTRDKEVYAASKIDLAKCLYLNGVNLMAQGDSARGVSSLLQSFFYVPYYPSAVVTIAQLDINNNRPDSAKKMLAESLRVNPQNVALLNMSGYVYYLDGDLKQAESFLTQAYKLDPGNVDTNKFLTLIRNQSAK
jgi:tetratricopeptide (TPR) repeat protein